MYMAQFMVLAAASMWLFVQFQDPVLFLYYDSHLEGLTLLELSVP